MVPNERTYQALKIELRDEEIANLSDAEIKTLVIRMLTELVEYGHNIEEKVKERRLGLKSMIWTRRNKETVSQNRMKKQELKKMRRGLGTSRTTLNIPTSES